jgi:aspartate/glutamate racemase
MPCNTAHYWYDEFASTAKVPFLHIADATMAAVRDDDPSGIRLGLMGTRGTLKAGFFQQRFAARFRINLARLRDLERGRYAPDSALVAYLRVIASEPETVDRILQDEPA